ncbi:MULTISPECIES: hypothetical protein [unclassified Bradyrhizobium]|uniref:hypothetical protein n=1 Tax=unclassified Bradyrhizobium TaxID=2631580 RepID=UPI002FF3F4C1
MRSNTPGNLKVNKPRELSAYATGGKVFVADGQFCPDPTCNRPVRCYDAEVIDNGLQIICAGCGLTLFAYHRYR